MSTVGDATSTAATTGTFSSAISGNGSLGKEEFLTLLVAQLKNQDPLNPQDGTEFTAQLAQFSSLEQLIDMNSSLSVLSETNQTFDRMSALGMIGQTVMAGGNDFAYTGEAVRLGYDLPRDASSVELYVLNDEGVNVATMSLSGDALSEGEHIIGWDGTDDNGAAVASGSYSMSVHAYDGDEKLTVTGLVEGQVVGVDLEDGNSIIVTTAGDLDIADVRHVRD
jgi:flagellar basal-body rod modification protein FlgD